MSGVKVEKIRQHYDAIAGIYDIHYDRPRGRCYHTHISTHVMDALPKGGRLLDIGCGTGLFVEKYVKKGGTAVGIDISRNMIKKARVRCPGSLFTLGTGDGLPFCSDSFDAVSSLLVFTYLKDPQAMLDEGLPCLKTRRIDLHLHAR